MDISCENLLGFFLFCRNDEEIDDFIFLSFLCENELTVIFFFFFLILKVYKALFV